jgi:hypothetical protein
MPSSNAPWFLCSHAYERTLAMGLSRAEVVDALDHATRSYPSGPSHAPDRRISCDGRLAVVHEPAERVVITVLWDNRTSR